MPVFISYSHSDASFVNKLAAHLVKRNAHVWVDSWELNVGDSILGRVQQAIQDSSALLVVLSKTSVASEWCKKELSAGLMRELDEKRVVVLPVLLEDCEIPIFLREKMYADFRKSFDVGLKALAEAVARVTNIDQGRIKSGTGNTDWAEDWGYDGETFRMTYTLIETSAGWPFSLLTEVILRCNEVVTRRYQEYVKAGLDWLGRMVLTEALIDLAEADDIRLILDDQFPKLFEGRIQDSKRNAVYEITIKCRRMGEDNGKDQLVNVTNYLRQIRDFSRQASRKPTREELERMTAMVRAL
jgi:TIR domain